MVTRLSQLFVRTLREDPAGAKVASHWWLARAEYIRRAIPGIYPWLSSDLKVIQKTEGILHEGMEATGDQEVRFPTLLPRDPCKVTNRRTEHGENLFRLQDRRGNNMLFGPTHGRMFTLLVSDLYNSYKGPPLMLFQAQTKYHDEARPHAGLFRGRESVMKDAYSFDVDDAGLEANYQAIRGAYIRIFNRLGLEYATVKAASGAIGGPASEEFQAMLSAGEDSFVRSPGGCAANVKVVTAMSSPAIDPDDVLSAIVVDTFGTLTISSLVDLLNTDHLHSNRGWGAVDTLKNVVLKVTKPDESIRPLAIGLPGDCEVDTRCLVAVLTPVEVVLFEEIDFTAHPSLVKGCTGPGMLGEKSPSRMRYLVDSRVVTGTEWAVGANQQGRHVMHLAAGRDFTSDGVADVAEVRGEDPAPDGSDPLNLEHGTEVDHIFQPGRRYAETLGLKILDRNGKPVAVAMGSYGIGVFRTIATIAETTCDSKGFAWSVELASYRARVVVTGKDQEMFQAAENLAGELFGLGFGVLYDDCKANPGVKFTDTELFGMPVAVMIGRGLVSGVVEIRNRRTGEKREVSVADVVTAVRGLAGN